MSNKTPEHPHRTDDKPTPTAGDNTVAMRRLVDLIARRTAEQHADGEFEDAPKLSRRARPRTDR
mgnify:CR=1 FL=1